MKQSHCHDLMMSFDEYVEYVFGRTPKTREFIEFTPQYRPSNRTIPSYQGNLKGTTTKKHVPTYTGSFVIGLAQTHKSNLVPVTNKEHIIDISNMRRN